MADPYVYNVRELVTGLTYDKRRVGECWSFTINKVVYIYIYIFHFITIIFAHSFVIYSRVILG